MADSYTLRFPCPHCDSPQRTEVEINASVSRESAEASKVIINDLPTVKCCDCGKFIELNVTDLDVQIEATAIHLA